jgi:hypothetical protein
MAVYGTIDIVAAQMEGGDQGRQEGVSARDVTGS